MKIRVIYQPFPEFNNVLLCQYKAGPRNLMKAYKMLLEIKRRHFAFITVGPFRFYEDDLIDLRLSFEDPEVWRTPTETAKLLLHELSDQNPK